MKDVVDGSLDLPLGSNLPRGVRGLLRPVEPNGGRWTKI